MVTRLFFKVAVACMYLTSAASLSLAQIYSPAEQLPPGMGKVEFENESMVVLRVRMSPHEKTPMHDIVSPRLVIWLTDAHMKDTGADGKASEYSRTSGLIEWITPRRHMGENMGDRSIDFLAIIPKVATGSSSERVSPR